jgi:hypothetical protein
MRGRVEVCRWDEGTRAGTVIKGTVTKGTTKGTVTKGTVVCTAESYSMVVKLCDPYGPSPKSMWMRATTQCWS